MHPRSDLVSSAPTLFIANVWLRYFHNEREKKVLDPNANEDEAYNVTNTTTNTRTTEGGVSVTYPSPAANFKVNVVKQGQLSVQQTLNAWSLSAGPQIYNGDLPELVPRELPVIHGRKPTR